MKNISIRDEKESIYLFSGMILGESDIDPLERIFSRLFDKIAELERNAPTPEGPRLNILEYSHDRLWKAQVETNKIVEELREKVFCISREFDLNRPAHTRMYKELDNQKAVIDQMEDEHLQEIEARKEVTKTFDKIVVSLALHDLAGIKRDRRLTQIEEFLGDL